MNLRRLIIGFALIFFIQDVYGEEVDDFTSPKVQPKDSLNAVNDLVNWHMKEAITYLEDKSDKKKALNVTATKSFKLWNTPWETIGLRWALI